MTSFEYEMSLSAFGEVFVGVVFIMFIIKKLNDWM